MGPLIDQTLGITICLHSQTPSVLRGFGWVPVSAGDAGLGSTARLHPTDSDRDPMSESRRKKEKDRCSNTGEEKGRYSSGQQNGNDNVGNTHGPQPGVPIQSGTNPAAQVCILRPLVERQPTSPSENYYCP